MDTFDDVGLATPGSYDRPIPYLARSGVHVRLCYGITSLMPGVCARVRGPATPYATRYGPLVPIDGETCLSEQCDRIRIVFRELPCSYRKDGVMSVLVWLGVREYAGNAAEDPRIQRRKTSTEVFLIQEQTSTTSSHPSA